MAFGLKDRTRLVAADLRLCNGILPVAGIVGLELVEGLPSSPCTRPHTSLREIVNLISRTSFQTTSNKKLMTRKWLSAWQNDPLVWRSDSFSNGVRLPIINLQFDSKQGN